MDEPKKKVMTVVFGPMAYSHRVIQARGIVEDETIFHRTYADIETALLQLQRYYHPKYRVILCIPPGLNPHQTEK